MLLFFLACPAPLDPPCQQEFVKVAERVQKRWPTAGAAWDDAYAEDCVWYWSHGKRSFDGMGVAMATLDARPSPTNGFVHVHGQHATGSVLQPSLLFFDQQPGSWKDWPLVGFGYHFDYEPCDAPELGCVVEGNWFVHEAGYHHYLRDAGSMSLATDADLREEALWEGHGVDPQGCQDVDEEDLRHKVGAVGHGRAWDLHVWIDPEGGPPKAQPYDPWTRWSDAQSRIDLAEEAFFDPDLSACGCDSRW